MPTVTRYVLGEFELEPNSYTLVRDSAPVAISRMRFQVLLYLIEQRHRVVMRKELVERFWDGHDVYEENLTKCISEVRKALDDQHKPHRFIETIPAVGYRYMGPAELKEDREPTVEEHPAPAEVAITAMTATIAAVELIPEPTPPARGLRSWAAIAMSFLVIAALGTAGTVWVYRMNAAAVSADTGPIRSLAVLPFKPIREQNRDEFLELGMADALITKLSNIRQITVTPTSSVRKYTTLTQDSVAAGNELAVESVLEGSIQRLDDRIRVTVRLVKVASGTTLWAETFDEKFADIFTLQDSISERVADALAVRLSTPEKERITKRYTDSSEAYQLYQKGRYFWNKRTEEGLRKGIDFFEQAIKTDAHYALAYAGLADSYLVANFNLLPPRDVFPKAKQAALKAIEIDPTLAEPHAALGITMMAYDRDWPSAEREFRRALSLNPNYGQGHQWYALSLAAAGKVSEAVIEAKKAQQADPVSLAVNANVGWVLFLAHDYDKTIEQCTKVIEMDSGFGLAYLYRGLAYEQKGQYEKAVADLEIAKGSQARPTVLGALGHAYAMSGNRAKAQAMLQKMEELSRTRYFPGFQKALIHIGLGEKDQAFALLEESFKDQYPGLIHSNAEPRFDPVRSDPRFKDLLQRIGL